LREFVKLSRLKEKSVGLVVINVYYFLNKTLYKVFFYFFNVFTSLHGMQTRSSDEDFVRLSVYPSARLSNGRKICLDFYTVPCIFFIKFDSFAGQLCHSG